MTANWATPDATLILSVEEGKDRKKWLAIRRLGIGGSDVAALLGESRYSTEFEVWLDKTGRGAENEATLAMEMGSRWEQGVADKFSEDTGLTVRRKGLMQSRKVAYLLANVDRLVDDGGGLECKAVNQFTRMPEDERYCNMPPNWYWQIIAYLLVTGRTHWYLAAAIGNTGWVTRIVKADDEQVQLDMAMLANLIPDWWHTHVVNDVVPEMGRPAVDIDTVELKDKYEFFIPEAGIEVRDRLREIRELKRDLDIEDKEIKAKLAAESGGARWLLADGQPILEFNPRSGRKSFQKAAMFKAEPTSGVQLLSDLMDLHERGVLTPWLYDQLVELVDRHALTEATYTKTGDPSTSLLIVGQKEERA